MQQSLDSLRETINHINKESRRRFKETFDLINEKFTALFPKVFRGGKAYLVLTDENNILETGVDIVVQPPGKKLQNITLLSGGEKALTALSLIFAMLDVRPTPFCILDEVDAPLDDNNIDRFNNLLKERVTETQFLIITHNKRTMEIMDALFGVTMEEPGSSKVVTVRLSEPIAAAA